MLKKQNADSKEIQPLPYITPLINYLTCHVWGSVEPRMTLLIGDHIQQCNWMKNLE